MDGESAAESIRTVRALHGSLPLETLEAYGSAGRLVRREFDDAERLRRELLDAHIAPRRFPPGVAGRLLAAWNAYVLQTAGEQLLQTVRRRSFGTVRAEIASRVLAFLGPAGRWVFQARRAATDPSHRIERNLFLPADPPAWPDRRYGPYPLSAAVATAAREVHAMGDAILNDLARSLVSPQEDLLRLQEILDSAAMAITYAAEPPEDEMFRPVSTAVHLRYALRRLFLFGQAAAMPGLLDTPEPATVASLVAGSPSRVDPWCLTDPLQRTILQSIPSGRAAIERLWAQDPAPAETIRVQAQIDVALRTGAIVFAADMTGERLGSFHRCPWPAIYEVRRPVTIGGTYLPPMRHFTFDVLGEPGATGSPYARQIVASVFVPADATADRGGTARGQEPVAYSGGRSGRPRVRGG